MYFNKKYMKIEILVKNSIHSDKNIIMYRKIEI